LALKSGEFQRVDDGGPFVETMPAPPREVEAAHVRDFVDEIADESSRSFSFQRVSDEEQQHRKRNPKICSSRRGGARGAGAEL